MRSSATDVAPLVAPDITGKWSGTAVSDLRGETLGIQLNIIERDGTTFGGSATVSRRESEPLLIPIVGTISGQGVLVIIGAGDGQRLLLDGLLQHLPDDGLDFTYVLASVTGAADFGNLIVSPVQ